MDTFDPNRDATSRCREYPVMQTPQLGSGRQVFGKTHRATGILAGLLLLSPALYSQSGVRTNAIYGRLPLSFEANRGQADPAARFLSHGANYTLFLTPREAVIATRKAAVGMRLLHGNSDPRIEGAG